MDTPLPERLAIDAFEIRLVDIHDVDIDQLHALSIAVRWPHRAEDWQFLLANGQGLAALDEIGRVLGSAMWFPHGDTFATVGMVITSPRLQTLGTGNALMHAALEACKGRAIRLNATRAAKRLYLSLDFHPECLVYQCQGDATPYPGMAPEMTDGEIRTLDVRDLDEIVHLDAAAFGVARPELMAALYEKSVGTTGLFRNGKLAAFAFCRRFGRGHVVGPVVAAADDDARAVIAPHVETHAGTFLRVDTHRNTTEFGTFLVAAGMPVFDTVTTMTKGISFLNPNTLEPGRLRTYGLATQALG